MAKRNPETTARNKVINELTAQLQEIQDEVLEVTGFDSVHSMHGKIGGKFDQFIDIKNEVISSPEHFISLWLEGYKADLISRGDYAEHSNFEPS